MNYYIYTQQKISQLGQLHILINIECDVFEAVQL